MVNTLKALAERVENNNAFAVEVADKLELWKKTREKLVREGMDLGLNRGAMEDMLLTLKQAATATPQTGEGEQVTLSGQDGGDIVTDYPDGAQGTALYVGGPLVIGDCVALDTDGSDGTSNLVQPAPEPALPLEAAINQA